MTRRQAAEKLVLGAILKGGDVARWGLVLVLASSTASGLAQPDPSSASSAGLDVERAVAREVRRTGAGYLADARRIAREIGGGDLARALASATLDHLRGRDERASVTIFRALRSEGIDGADPALVSALLTLWVETGIDADGRVFLVGNAGNGSTLYPLARAMDLARSARCDEARELLEELDDRIPRLAGPLLMGADGWERCGEPGRALGVLGRLPQREDSGSVDPRVAARVGEILLRIGDLDSAAYWCRLGASGAEDLPRIEHGAEACASAADALRGVLPRARRAFAGSRKAAMLEPALTRDERIRAGLDAAWVLIRSRESEDASEALEVLLQLESLALRTADRRVVAGLRAMALTTLERIREAKQAAASVRGSRLGPMEAIIGSLARSWVLMREGDTVAASTALTESLALARRQGLASLVAALEIERAELARWEGRRLLAQRHAESAIAAWTGLHDGVAWRPFADPAFPRRVVESLVSEGRGTAEVSSSRAGAMLEVAERSRRASRIAVESGFETPTSAQVRRYLAARNAGLLYYVIGETRSFLWLVEPGGVQLVELAAGDQLYDALEPLMSGRSPAAGMEAGAEEILGGILEAFPEDSGLMVSSDGFLDGIAWNLLPAPDGRLLREAHPISVVASLATVVDPSGATLRDRRSQPGLVAVVPRGDANFAPGAPLGTALPFEPLEMLPLAAGDLPVLARAIRSDPSVLHLVLPIEAAASSDGSVYAALPGESGAPDEVFDLMELFRPDLRADLLSISPRKGGWARHPASQVRAAFSIAETGARAVVVPLGEISEDDAREFWSLYYGALSRGESKVGALATSLERLEGRDLPAFQVVGHADTQVVDRAQEEWPFWAALGGGLTIILIAVIRAFWRRKDPFDIEPPEEGAG